MVLSLVLARAVLVLGPIGAVGDAVRAAGHANPREAMCAWCRNHAETLNHVTMCKNTEIQEMHVQMHKKIIKIIIENLPGIARNK